MKNLLAALAISVASAGSAIAAPVTINFTAEGMFSFGRGDNGEAFDWLGISAGDTITGSFTYDDDVIDYRLEDDWEAANYLRSSMSLTIGGTTYDNLTGITESSNVFEEIDYYYPERLISSFYDGFNALPDVVESSGYVMAFDRDVTLWDGLERSADELNQAGRRELQLSFTSATGTSHNLRSSNLTFSVAPVPLPAGGLLLASGLLGFGLMRRR